MFISHLSGLGVGEVAVSHSGVSDYIRDRVSISVNLCPGKSRYLS